MPECPVCHRELKREKQLNGQIYLVCPTRGCNYWEPTPDLAPPIDEDEEAWKGYDNQVEHYRETLIDQENQKEE